MKSHAGFIAALEQCGDSTPKALASYGVKEGTWKSEDEMFAAVVHQMRSVIKQANAPGIKEIVITSSS